MHIKELTIQEFENFTSHHILGNPYQSEAYAHVMAKNGYHHEFIGFVDEYNKIYAASLILIKKINGLFKYGYAPKGFIIDYFDKELLQNFTNAILAYYKKRLVFIKINPEIAIAEINPITNEKNYNQNMEIKNYLLDFGYIKLKDNLYFESIFPRYNGIVPLKEFNLKNLQKNTRNKIRRANDKGLKIEVADASGIDILYSFIKRKKNKDSFYYKEYYKYFSKSNAIDLFLVSIDTNDFLIKAQKKYAQELEKNAIYAKKLMKNKSERNLNLKMNSDRKLLSYKNDVIDARNKASEYEKIYIAGALVIKYKNRIYIAISGYDTRYKRFSPNYFLHYEILKYYQKYYDFADLNGMTGDFASDNPYMGLNEFKLGFKPKVYEFIGEYDLVILPIVYKLLLKSGKLAKTFNKKNLKIK